MAGLEKAEVKVTVLSVLYHWDNTIREERIDSHFWHLSDGGVLEIYEVSNGVAKLTQRILGVISVKGLWARGGD